MRNTLAVLIVLAKSPQGQATLDELEGEVARLVGMGDERGSGVRFSALDHLDILESGLVTSEGESLRISENGWAFLRELGIAPQESLATDFASSLQSLNLIDDLIGAEARLQIFDLAPRRTDQDADPITPQQVNDPEGHSEVSQPVTPGEPAVADESPMDDHRAAVNEDTSAAHDGAEVVPDAAVVLTCKFGSGLQNAATRSDVLTMLTTRVQRGMDAWRRHLERGHPLEEPRPSNANVERILFALLSLLAVISCAGMVAALMQVKSLRLELATLQREVLPLREHVARLDQTEKSREVSEKATEQKLEVPQKARPEQAPLVLSREEIQLVREYIKPAPIVGAPGQPINVGDPIPGPTIPFPSAVTEKVPKLLRARFAIRNGTILIVKRESRQIDAVLGPN